MKNGEDMACFKKTISYQNLCGPTDEENEQGVKVHENERADSCFSFDSVIRLRKKAFKYDDIRASRYCKVSKQYCISKFIVIIQITEDKNCFLWCI